MRRAERGEDVLRRRLAGRAGDADDARGRAVADGARDRRERGVRVVGDERRGGAAGERVRDEVAPPPTATNRSPSSIRRESICMPVTSSPTGGR